MKYYLTMIILVLALLGHTLAAEPPSTLAPGRWTPERAWTWYSSHPWLVGCNFLPSTAVNNVEMWQKETFDAKTLDRELGWAQELGFNTVRVFVNYAVWEADAAGLKDTFRQFLTIADKRVLAWELYNEPTMSLPLVEAAFKWAREVEFIKVTTGKLPASALPQRKLLVPTAEQSPVTWRYALEKPADDWFKPDFNDSGWEQGAAPFGREEPPITRKPNTVWPSADIWLRRKFEMPAGTFTDVALLLHHDEDTEVYLNGVLALNASGYNAAYEPFDITPEARAALTPGRNVFAVHCHQTLGGQYIDVGIEGVSLETLEHLTLSVDRKVLNPVREPTVSAKLTLTGFYSDGSQRSLGPTNAVIKAKTKSASGHVEVVSIEGDKVVPKDGGIATVEATLVQGDKRFKAATEVVVTPFYRDYHQTLVMKLFLGMEGEPVERLAKEPLFQKTHDVMCTFEEALDVIRKTDNLTRGIPKILYLVGWQKGGHDHGYPAWDEVNPRLKRNQDATALESLRWLIREARRFNTTVSLHINMVDAYKQSPLWDEYVAKDCLARDANGQLLVGGIQMKGEEMYSVVYPREWEARLAQRRIDGLINMIPELRDGHTIHIDVFIAQRDGGKPISPWHAKPGNGSLTPDKYVETQRKIFKYWRERGFDVTGEGIFWAHPPGEGFTGLQSMSWWYPDDPGYQMQIPECLMARGRTDRGGDGDFRFGSSMHGEEIWQKDKDQMPGFLGMFCRTTLPWYYLSRLERQKFENGALFYSDGVVARTEDGKRIIRKGAFVLREDEDLFVPALWQQKEIIAYSRQGYEKKSWQLPDDWREVRNVDLYRVTLDGCVPLSKGVPVTDAKLVLSLEKGDSVSIVPAGVRLSGEF